MPSHTKKPSTEQSPDCFRTWLQTRLSPEALQDLALYGASLSAVPSLVFWDDMEPLFQRFRADIEEVAAFYGDLATLAARGKARTVGQLINTLVWVAAEHHARQLVLEGALEGVGLEEEEEEAG